MLNNAGIGAFFVGVIHRGISLIILYRKLFYYEIHLPVFQLSQGILVESVNRTGKYNFLRLFHPHFPMLKEVLRQFHGDIGKNIFHQLGIARLGNSLVQGIKIVIIIGQAHRKSFDNGSRKILTIPAPLLFGIALNQFLIDFSTYQGNGLLFQILRLANPCSLPLCLNFLLGLLRTGNPPHPIEGIHIKGEGVDFSLIVGNGGIGKAIKFRKAIHILPNLFIVGMENVGTVVMNHDAILLVAVNISPDMIPLVNDQNFFPPFLCLSCKNSAKKSRTYYQIIKLCHLFLQSCLGHYTAPYFTKALRRTIAEKQIAKQKTKR